MDAKKISITEAISAYHNAGYLILPTKNKIPDVPEGTSVVNGIPPEQFNGSPQIAIIMKPDKECLDFDNHFGDAEIIFEKFRNDERISDIVKSLPCEKTPSGGYHLFFKCKKNGVTQKLASRPKLNDKDEVKPDALIETRAGSNYAVIYPSPGYELISENDLLNIPEITPFEREVLLIVAREFDEYDKPKKQPTEYEDPDRPGDKYNQDASAIDECRELLMAAGWKENKRNKDRLIRPDKDKGTSATWLNGGLYNFSANGVPFEYRKWHSPFAILALLKHSGDFKETAKELAKRYQMKPVSDKKEDIFQEHSEKRKKKLIKSNIISAMKRNQLASAEPTPKPLWQNILNENEIAIGAGETGVGKSIVAVNILEDIARSGRKVLYYDFELSKKQFEDRYKGYIFSENFFFADWEPDPDQPDINFNFDTIKADIEETGIDIVCIDNITALSLKNTVDPDAALEVMRGLKWLQKHSKLTVLVLAHVPKRHQTNPMSINDLAGSKLLANFADSVFFVNFSKLGDNVRYIKHVKTRTPKLCSTFSVMLEKGIDGMVRAKFDGFISESEHLTGQPLDARIITTANLRDKEKKSQSEIARIMQTDQSTVSRWLKKYDDRKLKTINEEIPY